MAELVAGRYGTALFELAVENNRVDAIKEEVINLKNILSEEKEFVELIKHPRISLEARRKMVEDIFEGKISDELLGLIDLTIQKGRQNFLIEIFEDFLSLVNNYYGIAVVSVTSHTALSDAQKQQLIKKLETITKKTVSIVEYIDETLIGGIVLRMGDRIVDYSIKGMIGKMTKQMLTSK